MCLHFKSFIKLLKCKELIYLETIFDEKFMLKHKTPNPGSIKRKTQKLDFFFLLINNNKTNFMEP